jgi:hypothetical protein
MGKKKQRGTCILCGKFGKITREHAPPRVAFPFPKPTNLLTAPTCLTCNNSMSDLDEEFGNFLGAIAGNSPLGAKLWADRWEGISKNERHMRQLQESIFTLTDRRTGKQVPAWKFNGAKFDPIFDKCFRAIFHNCYRRVYPIDKRIEIFFPKQLDDKMHSDFISALIKRHIGGQEMFVCGVSDTVESPDMLAAVMIFYQTFAVVGITHKEDWPAGHPLYPADEADH